MSEFNFENVRIFLNRKKNKLMDIIKNIVWIVLGIYAFGSFALSLIFFSIKWLPIGIFFLIPSGILLFIVFFIINILDSSKKNYVNKELQENKELLEQIKKFINENNKFKNEFSSMLKDLNEGLKDAKKIADKICSIEKTLRKKDWDSDYIEKKLKSAKTEIEKKRLTEQKDNINKLIELQNKLIEQLLNIKHTFNSVYTKLTLLDTSNRIEFDSVETEIKKILDFKLKVVKYEEELDKELRI